MPFTNRSLFQPHLLVSAAPRSGAVPIAAFSRLPPGTAATSNPKLSPSARTAYVVSARGERLYPTRGIATDPRSCSHQPPWPSTWTLTRSSCGVLHAFYLEHEYCGELDTGIGDYCG